MPVRRWKMSVIGISIFALIPIFQVITRTVNITGLISWLISIALTIKALYPGRIRIPPVVVSRDEALTIFILITVHLASLWAVGLNINHFHRDEFIIAYTSVSLPKIHFIDWFKGYPDDWVAQFPILFHILQKPFLLVEPSLLSIRFSVWPYCAGIILYLYLLLRRIHTYHIASILTLLFIFWAPTLNFFSLGEHNASSTLFILATLYHFTAEHETHARFHQLMSGIFLALSMLTYTGSYISISIPIVLAVSQIRRVGTRKMIFNLLPIIIISISILLPFLTHAAFVRNYFMDRYNAVNLYDGYWTDSAIQRDLGVSQVQIYLNGFLSAFSALIIPGVGGFGGFYFGFQPLFTPITVFLMIGGILYLIKRQKSKADPLAPYYLTLMALSFILGPASTVQPPAVHRLSVVFPVISICMAYGLFAWKQLISRKFPKAGLILFIVLCCIFFISNALHFNAMMANDVQDYPYTPALSESVKARVPQGETLYVADYYGDHLPKELFFRTGGSIPIRTASWEEMRTFYTGGPIVIMNPTYDQIIDLLTVHPDYAVEYFGYEQYPQRILSEPTAFLYPVSTKTDNSEL